MEYVLKPHVLSTHHLGLILFFLCKNLDSGRGNKVENKEKKIEGGDVSISLI